MKQEWDAVVLGAGVLGLGAAALLARGAGSRVLALGPAGPQGPVEVGGGWSAMALSAATGQPVRPIPSAVGLVFPDLELPSLGRAELHTAFPRAGRTIRRALATFDRWAGLAQRAALIEADAAPWWWCSRGSGPRLGAWLRSEVADPRLAAVLAAGWPLEGPSPDEISLGAHGRGFATPFGLPRDDEAPGCRFTERTTAQIEARGGAVRAEAVRTVERDGDSWRVNGEHVAQRLVVALDPAAAASVWGGPTPEPLGALVRVSGRLEQPPRALGASAPRLWVHATWSPDASARASGATAQGRPPVVGVQFAGLDRAGEVRLVAPIGTAAVLDPERVVAGIVRAAATRLPRFAAAFTAVRWEVEPQFAAVPRSSRRLDGPGLSWAETPYPGADGALLGGLGAVAGMGWLSLRQVRAAATR